jgi:hypothetical protein
VQTQVAAARGGLPLGAWQQAAEDLVVLGQAVQQRQDDQLEVSPQRLAQQAFARLSRLPPAAGRPLKG